MTCPIPDCGQPAGTRCTMAGCPGNSLRARSLTAQRKGGEVSPSASSPTISLNVSHDALHSVGGA